MKYFASLPDETLVYCGHEYTQQNLEWAVKIDKNLIQTLNAVLELRAQGISTIPSTIAREKKINLFMRCHEFKTLFETQRY